MSNFFGGDRAPSYVVAIFWNSHRASVLLEILRNESMWPVWNWKSSMETTIWLLTLTMSSNMSGDMANLRWQDNNTHSRRWRCFLGSLLAAIIACWRLKCLHERVSRTCEIQLGKLLRRSSRRTVEVCIFPRPFSRGACVGCLSGQVPANT